MKPIIETRDLTIRFGSLIANDRLNISIEPGKIHLFDKDTELTITN